MQGLSLPYWCLRSRLWSWYPVSLKGCLCIKLVRWSSLSLFGLVLPSQPVSQHSGPPSVKMPIIGEDPASYHAFRKLLGHSVAYPADSTQVEVIEWDQASKLSILCEWYSVSFWNVCLDSSAATKSPQPQHITVSELGQRKHSSIRIM